MAKTELKIVAPSYTAGIGMTMEDIEAACRKARESGFEKLERVRVSFRGRVLEMTFVPRTPADIWKPQR